MDDAHKTNATLNTTLTFIICCTIIICSAIAGVTVYNINDRNLMAKNIENAMEKGIDPLAVRCSYQQYADAVCATYALNKK